MNENEAKSKVRDGNFYVVQSFMVKDLKLKGLELACYAIIYGFSQADDQTFTGSLQYLSDWTCSSKQAVMNALKKLVDKGYLNKKENYINGVKFVGYSAIYEAGMQETSQGGKESCMGGSQESCIPPSKKVGYPMQETLPNNIKDNLPDNIVPDNITDNKDIDIDKKDKNKGACAHDSSFSKSNTEEKIIPNAWSMALIQCKYIDENDLQLEEYNSFLKRCNSEYGARRFSKALAYFIGRFNGFDENGERIGNRLAYLKASLTDGLERLSRDIGNKEGLSDGAKRIADSWGL